MSGTARALRGRLFGPGCAEGGSEVGLRWQGDLLEIAGPARTLLAPASQLRLEAAGFNHGQLRAGWESDGGGYALFIDEDREAFLAAAPPLLTGAMQTVSARQRRVARRFRAAVVAYALILLLPLLALAAFFMQSDRLAAWAVRHVPVGVEQRLGQLVLAQTRARLTLHEHGPAHAAVKQLGGELSKGSAYAFRWYVAEDASVNAFAAPGGIVVVNTGLLRQAGDAAELAGVLAHEIAHVEQRHALQALARNAGFGVLLSLALGDWSGSAAGAWAGRLAELKFSRDAEMQADAEAVRRLHAAGLAPDAMARFFGRLAEDERRLPGLSLLATHPPSAERMAALQAQIAALPARHYRPPAVDWNAVIASLPPEK